MKRPQSVVLFSVVAFLIGAASNSPAVTQIFGGGRRIGAVSSPDAVQIGPGRTARALHVADANATAAPTHVGDGVTTGDRDLSGGSIEEYAGDAEEPGGQGSGYGDVYDQNGHLLWRFAVLERSNSNWTIFKYFSHRKPEQKNSKTGQDPSAEPNKSGSP